MRIGLKFITPALAAGAAAVAIAAAPAANADSQQGPPNPLTCVSSPTATKCQKAGDAELNSSIPAPYPGVYGIYGPFWAG
ncbi:MAG: hypothetical protein JWR32_665 [Mycobacterium sp.]|nr:hypothetical protein [Mycobacterium sp.]